MGLPIHDEAAADQPQDESSSTPASALPPAALDLAAKLFDLARTGETSELRSYVVAGIPKNLTNHAGDTLIMLAAYHGHASTVSMLLELGADPNVLNERGQSPLAGAVFKGWDEVVKVLCEGGADMTLGTPNAVDCAHMFRKEEYLKLFGVLEGDSA
ncbi:ankyrin [Lophium mytilinum]|uniref:Ankyrin n=1 Tax=Lophium mytilinum TaxID=390894 RepID=A0A6A6RFB6_9PEZI|nr:ankyrin [Lophium mytilinum]